MGMGKRGERFARKDDKRRAGHPGGHGYIQKVRTNQFSAINMQLDLISIRLNVTSL